MTNGEKFLKDYYPNSSITRDSLTGRVFVNEDNADFTLPIEWWDAEYKESTIKNDLAVDCISRNSVLTLLDYYRDKHFENRKKYPVNHDILHILRCIRNLPSVTLQPCEDAVSRRAVLDLIADYDLSMGQVVRGIHALPSATL